MPSPLQNPAVLEHALAVTAVAFAETFEGIGTANAALEAAGQRVSQLEDQVAALEAELATLRGDQGEAEPMPAPSAGRSQ